MITYVDTSTLIKLLVAEPGSDRARTIWQESTRVAAVRLIAAESAAALAAAERSGRISHGQTDELLRRTGALITEMSIVEVTADLVDRAASLARAEALRGYDAVHLAAALTIGADVLTSADTELCAAAARRGMHVADPLDRGR